MPRIKFFTVLKHTANGTETKFQRFLCSVNNVSHAVLEFYGDHARFKSNMHDSSTFLSRLKHGGQSHASKYAENCTL
jgi:hypothetical protein